MTDGLESAASVTTGVPSCDRGTSMHRVVPTSILMSEGAAIDGGVVSWTVTVCVSLKPSFMRESVAVQLIRTVLRPSTTVGENVGTRVPSTRSRAVPAPMLAVVRVVVGPSASMVLEGGAVTLGGVVSTTVTSCVAVAVIPHWSVALQVIVLAPRPDTTVGESVGTKSPPNRPITVPAPILAVVRVVVGPSASTVMLAGGTIAGEFLSIKVTYCCWSGVVLPLWSVAFQTIRWVPRRDTLVGVTV